MIEDYLMVAEEQVKSDYGNFTVLNYVNPQVRTLIFPATSHKLTRVTQNR